eukprot:489078-Hanusia_phi.AAC.2
MATKPVSAPGPVHTTADSRVPGRTRTEQRRVQPLVTVVTGHNTKLAGAAAQARRAGPGRVCRNSETHSEARTPIGRRDKLRSTTFIRQQIPRPASLTGILMTHAYTNIRRSLHLLSRHRVPAATSALRARGTRGPYGQARTGVRVMIRACSISWPPARLDSEHESERAARRPTVAPSAPPPGRRRTVRPESPGDARGRRVPRESDPI